MAKPILKALKGEKSKIPPFWLMRQAGRYMPEYRKLRENAGSFMDLCLNPDLAAEVTMQPINRFDMDAAILFSDILVVPMALGQEVNFVKGVGPKLGKIPNIEKDWADGFMKKLQPVFQTVQKVSDQLPKDKTLIGFAGSPWTVACYMINGGGSRDFARTRALAYKDPKQFILLIELLVQATAEYLKEQIKAGAQVIQLFDSWSGLLPEREFARWVVLPTARIVSLVRKEYPDIPIIGFPKGAGAYYGAYAKKTGVTALGFDWSFPLSEIAKIQKHMPVQGNLDPIALFSGGKALQQGVADILKKLGDGPLIFNLGHGVIKETPPERVDELAKLIRSWPKWV